MNQLFAWWCTFHTTPYQRFSFQFTSASGYLLITNASQKDDLLHIYRYLNETQEDGLILKPSNNIQVGSCVESNFKVLCGREDPNYRICAKSRACYLVTFTHCSIMCVSKLHKEISLLYLHSEYFTLSQYLLGFLHFKDIDQTVIEGLGLNH